MPLCRVLIPTFFIWPKCTSSPIATFSSIPSIGWGENTDTNISQRLFLIVLVWGKQVYNINYIVFCLFPLYTVFCLVLTSVEHFVYPVVNTSSLSIIHINPLCHVCSQRSDGTIPYATDACLPEGNLQAPGPACCEAHWEALGWGPSCCALTQESGLDQGWAPG